MTFDRKDLVTKTAAAIFYALSSFTITVVNKHVLTVNQFPSFPVCNLNINL